MEYKKYKRAADMKKMGIDVSSSITPLVEYLDYVEKNIVINIDSYKLYGMSDVYEFSLHSLVILRFINDDFTCTFIEESFKYNIANFLGIRIGGAYRYDKKIFDFLEPFSKNIIIKKNKIRSNG